MTWKPIETAAKEDGLAVLLWDGAPNVGYWSSFGRCWQDWEASPLHRVTHWAAVAGPQGESYSIG